MKNVPYEKPEMGDELQNEEYTQEALQHEQEQTTASSRVSKRKRLEDLLEERRLQREFDDYDYYLGEKKSYYEDDIFSDLYSNESE